MFNDLKAILASKFEVDATDMTPDSRLQDLELDSLDLAELALIIQDELGTKVTDTELRDLQQLTAIADLIESRNAPV